MQNSGAGLDENVVRRLAYQLWEQDGCPSGRSDEFWYDALRHLEAVHATPAEPADPHPSDEDRENVYNPSPGGDRAVEGADKSLAKLRTYPGSVA